MMHVCQQTYHQRKAFGEAGEVPLLYDMEIEGSDDHPRRKIKTLPRPGDPSNLCGDHRLAFNCAQVISHWSAPVFIYSDCIAPIHTCLKAQCKKVGLLHRTP